MTRRLARELALQTLYSIEVGKHDPAGALRDLEDNSDLGLERAFVTDFVLGTLEHAESLDGAIAPLLQGWTIERLPTLDRLILRMGLWELRYRPETPRAVALNEAVELAKKFSTEESGGFVNGVLASASAVSA